ncbi:Zn(2)-C6 fungal-type domain-containing protein [Favolaschia claudopus]|uniref:Zn(2)-C6 fungal-type domain-containing protein n=1 Tax=Favolaschia claudopus TaxID=2862362 RepID=A0AAW0CMX4_9AGAR
MDSTVALKPKKPPACNPCKARRVLCHPQPNGAPCPRCVERRVLCTTTPVPRGRPRKNFPHQPLLSSLQVTGLDLHPGPCFESSEKCPDLSPEFVSHCFEELRMDARYAHPTIAATSIRSDMRAVAFDINLLPPQSRVLALCMVTYGSLWSYHESVLGSGPQPESMLDQTFSSSRQELLKCGVRRAPVYRALRAEAFKAAWEIGAILMPSNENAATCYLLDLMDQTSFGSAGRPWATAHFAHLRTLVPNWWLSGSMLSTGGFPRWTGALLVDCIISARRRTPLVITRQDQLLLCGKEPPSLENLISSLENSINSSDWSTFHWASLRPYLYHMTSLARQLHDTLTGEYAHSGPLSEAAILTFINTLSKLHAALSLLLDRLEHTPNVPGGAIYTLSLGFAGLALPFYHEVQYRESACNNVSQNARLQALREQAHDMAVLGGRALAHGIRMLPQPHCLPYHWTAVRDWAEFLLREADGSGNGNRPLAREATRDLETFARELKHLGYSLDAASTPEATALIERLEKHVDRALVSLFAPVSPVLVLIHLHDH